MSLFKRKGLEEIRMINKIIRHKATSFIRMSEKKYERWGKKTLCGKKFYRGDERLTTSERWVNCSKCLEKLISFHEARLDFLRWAMKDRKSIRGLVLGGD